MTCQQCKNIHTSVCKTNCSAVAEMLETKLRRIRNSYSEFNVRLKIPTPNACPSYAQFLSSYSRMRVTGGILSWPTNRNMIARYLRPNGSCLYVMESH
ncbi:hypothetical protein BaRGS_00000621 [Batillaria attramentaria]|uniref:Uncharacterized protein n=1 Tax=Batillaria attramentaria TaxID=370345 RepID=A0ABD0M9F7_9CAEN